MSQSKPGSKKSDFYRTISKFLSKVAEAIKKGLYLIYQAIQHLFDLVTVLFRLCVSLLASPVSNCVFAISLFVLVCSVALVQWFSIGIFYGSLLGINSVWGFGVGVAGALTGLAINVFQLGPEIYTLSRLCAKAFLGIGVNPQTQSSDDQPNLSETVANWSSKEYKDLKAWRNISYGFETTVVLVYCGMTGLSFWSLVTAAICLILPEQTLKFTASCVSFYAKLQDEIRKQSEDTTPDDHLYL